jgi:hypothetical protein
MKRYLYLAIGFLLLIITVLNTGLYRDDEFHDLSIFLKHRPTFKAYFYSPIGMSDRTLEDLSPGQQGEMIAFNEFVRGTGILFKGDDKAYIPLLLIQLTLTSFVMGTLASKSNGNIRIWIPVVHFAFNFMVTALGITIGLMTGSLIITVVTFAFIVLANYMTGKLLIRKATSNPSKMQLPVV